MPWLNRIKSIYASDRSCWNTNPESPGCPSDALPTKLSGAERKRRRKRIKRKLKEKETKKEAEEIKSDGEIRKKNNNNN